MPSMASSMNRSANAKGGSLTPGFGVCSREQEVQF